MEKIWEFYINDVLVEEPIGWDAVELTLQRDPIFQGLENIYSDNITFWDTGAQLIIAEYDIAGIDAVLNYKARYSCDSGDTFSQFVFGVLNAYFYSKVNNEVTIKIEPSGLHRKVKNRLTTPVNLNSNVSIGGEPMSVIDPFDLGMHSKEIVQQGQVEITLPTFSETYTPDPPNDTLYFTIPFDTIDFAEFSEWQLRSYPYITSIQATPEVGSIYHNDSSDPIEVSFDYTFDGTITDIMSLARSYNLAIVYSVTNNSDPSIPGPGVILVNYGAKSPGAGIIMSQVINEIGTLNLNVPAGYSVYFYFVFSNYDNSNVSPQVATIGLTTNTFKITGTITSIALPSTSKSFLVHEAFAKLSESMTDEIDSFRSDFFGRTNSKPYSYDNNGCGSWTAISNGLNIRKMKDGNGNLYPITTTFQDLFDSLNALWNLGMKIEKDPDTGKEYIRVEPKSYFYNPEPILNCLNISDLKTYPAQDLIFNNFKIGYEKWNLNISKTNGIDEFNTVRSYTLPVKNANKTLTALSKYIGSGYVIEQTRRLQYQELPTTDFETDNDLFFICTNRDTVDSDLYTDPAVLTSYPAGTISERDENFTGIDKVISPQTCYNLRISPARNAQNWYNYISASIWKNPTAPIKFVSGEGNYLETDTMINDCIKASAISQNQDLLASDLMGTDAVPIYLPEYLEFTYPISFDEFITTMDNSEKAIQVSCSSIADKLGFIVSEKYGPNTEGGISTFKLIRGSCILGDFNEDFNDDFFDGNC